MPPRPRFTRNARPASRAAASVFCVLLPVAAAASTNAGGPFVFTYDNPDVGTPAVFGSTAVIETISASFDETTDVFGWDAVYAADTAAELPTGFTLVVNDGPMPKYHLGELAVLYFEAEDLTAAPVLTAYAYNGDRVATSHRTSNFRDLDRPNPAPPDRIDSSLNSAGFLLDARVQDFTEDGREKRRMSVLLDATTINNHTPQQTPRVSGGSFRPLSWYGLGFAHQIGIWFHPFNNINPEYDDAGFLTFGFGDDANAGWQVLGDNFGAFDKNNLDAVARPIPEPAAALPLLAALLTYRRTSRRPPS